MGSVVFTKKTGNSAGLSGAEMHLRRKKKKEPICGVYSEKEFRALLDHEQRRSDRTKEKFSVAVFDVGDVETDMDKVCLLPDNLVGSSRSTDEVGWFDKNRIGVLLPDTTAKGARHFTRYFSTTLSSALGTIAPKIYTYPSHYLESSAEDPYEEEVSHVPPPSDSSRHKEMPDPLLGLEPYLGVAIPGWKRAFDMICSSTGLIVLSPLLMLVAIMIKIVSPGPVFFVQERVGYLGKHFGLLKVRTMKAGTDTSVHEDYVRELMRTGESMKKLGHDPRIIPFGNLFRKTGIDELPQLINVVRGQMSLVGPRPCLPAEFEEYLQWHKRRFYTAPGITGLWQVSGKNRLTFKEMIRRDITYEQKRSLGLDLKILFKTLPAVAGIMRGDTVIQEGYSHDGKA